MTEEELDYIPERAYRAFQTLMEWPGHGHRGFRYYSGTKNARKVLGPKPTVCPICKERKPENVSHRIPRRFWWEYGVAEHILFQPWNLVWTCRPCNGLVELGDEAAFALLRKHHVVLAPYIFGEGS